MNERPTPETDAAIIERRHIHKSDGSVQLIELIEAEFSRKLERERDEAREKLSATWQSLRDLQDEVLRLTFENRELRNLINE